MNYHFSHCLDLFQFDHNMIAQHIHPLQLFSKYGFVKYILKEMYK